MYTECYESEKHFSKKVRSPVSVKLGIHLSLCNIMSSGKDSWDWICIACRKSLPVYTHDYAVEVTRGKVSN